MVGHHQELVTAKKWHKGMLNLCALQALFLNVALCFSPFKDGG